MQWLIKYDCESVTNELVSARNGGTMGAHLGKAAMDALWSWTAHPEFFSKNCGDCQRFMRTHHNSI